MLQGEIKKVERGPTQKNKKMESTLYPLLLIPLIGILIIIPMRFDTQESIIKGKQIALFTSIVALLESIRL